MTEEKLRFMDDLLHGGVKDKVYTHKNEKSSVSYTVTGVEYGVNLRTGKVELVVHSLEEDGASSRKFLECLYDVRDR